MTIARHIALAILGAILGALHGALRGELHGERLRVLREVFGGLLLALLLGAGRAEAVCTVTTAGVGFGPYDVLATTATTSTGDVSITCGNERNIGIELSAGSSGTYANRELRAGAERIFYNLFLDPAMTVIWGNGTPGTGRATIPNPRNNHPEVLTIFGRIPPLQDAVAGAYGDTVMVTVLF